MISKEKLSFDPTNALSIAASDTVGAYITGQLADLAIVDGGNSITVDAVDLDIRDLEFATDSVDVSGSEVALDAATLAALESITVENGAGAAAVNIQDGGNSITVDATDLDIRDLSSASDSVAAWLSDGAGTALTSTLAGSKQALDVNIAASDIEIDVEDDKANTAILSTQKDVTTTTGVLLASQQADRRFLYVQNVGLSNIFVGAAGVTASTGIRMSSGSIAEFRLGPALSLHAVAAVGTVGNVDVRLMELA